MYHTVQSINGRKLYINMTLSDAALIIELCEQGTEDLLKRIKEHVY